MPRPTDGIRRRLFGAPENVSPVMQLNPDCEIEREATANVLWLWIARCRCGARPDGAEEVWECTRTRGHTGPHVASNGAGYGCRWPWVDPERIGT